MVQDAVIVVDRSDVAAEDEQFGQHPVTDPPFDIAPFAAPRAVFARFLRGQPEADALLRELVGAHPRQDAGDRFAQHLGRQLVRQGRKRAGANKSASVPLLAACSSRPGNIPSVNILPPRLIRIVSQRLPANRTRLRGRGARNDCPAPDQEHARRRLAG